MRLDKLTLSGFRCFGPKTTVIEFEPDLTVFIGANGTGKTAVLQALARMFGAGGRGRGLQRDDFHVGPDESHEEPRELQLEALFSFEELEDEDEDHSAVPAVFQGLTCDEGGKIYLRVRLEGHLTFEGSADGEVEEEINVVSTLADTVEERHKSRLRASVRNRIQVHLIGANRDPVREMASTGSSTLGRLLRAGTWTDEIRSEIRATSEEASKPLTEHDAIQAINHALSTSWSALHKGNFFKIPAIRFHENDLEGVLGGAAVVFRPSHDGPEADVLGLSDGHRSLFHMAMVHAAHGVERMVSEQSQKSGEAAGFSIHRMRIPSFSMLCLEEPENNLAPHYLGRVARIMKEFGAGTNSQAAVSTHSSSMVSRVRPSSLRYLRLDKNRLSVVTPIPLPEESVEACKFVNEAIRTYPEIFFARVVILAEGESERVVIPRVFAALGDGVEESDDLFSMEAAARWRVDDSFISVVPIGGRHVNHFWRLLDSLRIPVVTLLDLDLGREGGGWGRVKYAATQLFKLLTGKKKKELAEYLEEIPAWDSEDSPVDENPEEGCITWLDYLEQHNVFFSAPLDFDYLMLRCFPDHYRRAVEGERRPRLPKNRRGLLKSVFGRAEGQDHYDDQHDDDLAWYRYLFINKSKPASHMLALGNLSDEQLRSRLPEVLKRLIETVRDLAEKLPE